MDPSPSFRTFRAGAASLPLEPPLGLPMVGFVRQRYGALGYGTLPLEVGAVAFECGQQRVVICAADVVGIAGSEAAALVRRVADKAGAAPEGVLLNWSHTHLAPPAGLLGGAVFGEVTRFELESIESFAKVIQDKIVSVASLAIERLEPARVVWGQADVDVAVNRRERTPDGSNGGTILGWNPDELVDTQATVLQARRPDESAIATVVGYGCHPVTTGYDMFIYSADFPGELRRLVRLASGGECLFLQGAGGNVLPRFAMTDDESEARRMGMQLAVEALGAVAARVASPVEVVAGSEGSVTPITTYRRRLLDVPDPALCATSEVVTIPLQPHPDAADIERLRDQFDADLEAARQTGDNGRIRVAYYHAAWARSISDQLQRGDAPVAVSGPIHAIRIGDGVIVTAPGETFTEYGLAVKERSPAAVTMYAGYTNGLLGYLPTSAEYAFGGYEAGYGYKSFGLPSLFDPSVEEICVRTGVRLAERLFPAATPWDEARGWTASGDVRWLPPPEPLVHPQRRAASTEREQVPVRAE